MFLFHLYEFKSSEWILNELPLHNHKSYISIFTLHLVIFNMNYNIKLEYDDVQQMR